MSLQDFFVPQIYNEKLLEPKLLTLQMFPIPYPHVSTLTRVFFKVILTSFAFMCANPFLDFFPLRNL